MVKETEEFVMMSDLETGEADPNSFEVIDAHRKEFCRAAWPRIFELASREGKGKRIISHIHNAKETDSAKRHDRFIPKYEDGRCKAPVKDSYGQYTKRCSFVVPAPGTEERKRWEQMFESVLALDDEDPNKGIYKGIKNLDQFIVMKHGEKHFQWWIDSHGKKETMPDGNVIIRPPSLMRVKLPKWKKVVKGKTETV